MSRIDEQRKLRKESDVHTPKQPRTGNEDARASSEVDSGLHQMARLERKKIYGQRGNRRLKAGRKRRVRN